MRFVRSRVQNPEDAKEIVQEVHVRYLQALKSQAPIEDEVRYLFGIGDFVIRDHWRKKGRAKKFFAPIESEGDLTDRADERPRPDVEEESRQRDELLQRAIESLSPVQRAMILLKYVKGLSVEEAAIRCGLSKSKANRVLHDARIAIRKFFKRQGEGQP